MRDCEKPPQTILLVDDEDAVRAFASLALRRAGFRVFEAGNGIEALRMCEHPQQRVDLLLSDIVMPGMDGWELADDVRLLLPEVRVILMSGHAGELLSRSFDGYAFLAKPFTVQGLLKKVHEALCENGRAR